MTAEQFRELAAILRDGGAEVIAAGLLVLVVLIDRERRAERQRTAEERQRTAEQTDGRIADAKANTTQMLEMGRTLDRTGQLMMQVMDALRSKGGPHGPT